MSVWCGSVAYMTPTLTVAPEWLSRKAAATYMSVSVQTIDRWARSGRITRYATEPGISDARYRRTELDGLMQVVEPPFDRPENLDGTPRCSCGCGSSTR